MFSKITNGFKRFVVKLSFVANLWGGLPKNPEDIKKIRKLFKYILNNTKENKFWLDVYPSHVSLAVKEFLCIDEEAAESSKSIYKHERYNKAVSDVENHFKKHKGPKILLISHEFSRTGAPKAVLMLAGVLKKVFGVSPVVTSTKDGPMAEEFEKEGIMLLNFRDAFFSKDSFKKFSEKFDVIIATSRSFNFLMMAKHIRTPIIWWSHEIFKPKDINQLENFVPYIAECWAGSPLTKQVFEKMGFGDKTSLMLYGLDKIDLQNNAHDKITFSVMGTLEERKGQDVLLNAINKLPASILNKCKFYIIGSSLGSDNKFEKKLKNIKTPKAEVEFIPAVPFEELLDYYSLSDVIIVPSKVDPMPIVATYGFMFSKLVICSDSIGTALLVEDDKTGVVFKSGNANDLSLRLKKVVDNFDSYKAIAATGNEVYKNNFSSETFERIVKDRIYKVLRTD